MAESNLFRFVDPKTIAPSTRTIKVEIEIPEILAINVPKMDKVLQVNMAGLPPVSLAYLLVYGFRQQQDTHSSVKAEAPGAAKEVENILAERFTALGAGEIPSGGGRQSALSKIDSAYLTLICNTLRLKGKERKERATKLSNGEISRRDLARELAVRQYGKKATGPIIDKLDAATLVKAEALVRDQSATIEMAVPEEIMA